MNVRQEKTMTWDSFHRRGEVLRTVEAVADTRRDGLLPMDVAGVAETFGDELSLLAALQLRWHTRLAGRIERELNNQPMDLEQAVVAAWRVTADELPGIRAILDRHRAEPLDAAMAEAMTKSAAKEHTLLAVMAGRASMTDRSAARVGAELEARARSTYVLPAPEPEDPNLGLLEKLKAVIAA
jgi:hypothetical protein